MERITLAIPAAPPPRLERALALAIAELERRGIEVRYVVVPARGLPDTADEATRRLAGQFAATPGVLVESWRVARHLDSVTAPGDVLLLTDHRGFGGMYALEQAAVPPEQRRIVWTLGGDGLALERFVVAGTLAGAEVEEAAAIDWELVQYRHSEAVLTLGDRAGALIADWGAATVRLTVPAEDLPAPTREPARVLQLPERVSRRAQTAGMLRALTGVLEERPDVTVFVSSNDAPDLIWTGTSWEAAEPALRPFDDRIHRTEDLVSGAVVILGDVLEVPSADVVAASDEGRTAIVAAGSPAAARWKDAPTWENEDDLAEVVRRVIDGAQLPPRSVGSAGALPHPEPRTPVDRARQVSVGIPVFRDVEFLDECVESILAQEQPPHEVVLLDDGSHSREVDARLDRWAGERPGLVRVMRQPNRGVCVARNAMLESMTGDSFLFVDQDDVLAPGFISRCAQALRNDPALWAVATWTEFFGSYEAVEAKPPFDRRIGTRENPIVSTAALVDMRVRDVGIRFAPDLAFLFCEDWHVWSQIVAAGGTMGLVPDPLIRHRVHTDSGGFRRTEAATQIGTARATAPLLQGPATGRPSDT